MEKVSKVYGTWDRYNGAWETVGKPDPNSEAVKSAVYNELNMIFKKMKEKYGV